MTVRSWQLARVARVAGVVAIGLAAKSVLRALLERRERGLVLATAGGALATQAAQPRGLSRVTPSMPAVASISVVQPFEASRLIEALPSAARMMVTEVTVIERRRRR